MEQKYIFFLTKKIIKQNIKVIRRHLVSEKEKQKTNYQMSVPLKGKKKGKNMSVFNLKTL